jgi:hypothetical protein
LSLVIEILVSQLHLLLSILTQRGKPLLAHLDSGFILGLEVHHSVFSWF